MPPKAKSALPVLHPETNPEDKVSPAPEVYAWPISFASQSRLLTFALQLPEDVRGMTECPFPVKWSPLATVVTLASQIKLDPLRATLKRKEQIRHLNVSELALRLDPASPLAVELRDPMDAFVASGGQYETYQPSPAHTAALLGQRFDRDRAADWKTEYYKRKLALNAAESEAKAAEDAVASATSAHEAAEAAYNAWREANPEEASKSLGEPSHASLASQKSHVSDARPLHESAEEEALEEAQEKLSNAEARAKLASDRHATAIAEMAKPYSASPAYWVEGIGSGFDGIEGAVNAGVPLRAVIYGRPSSLASDPAAVVPDVFAKAKERAGKSGWKDKMGLVATVEIDIPASPEGEQTFS